MFLLLIFISLFAFLHVDTPQKRRRRMTQRKPNHPLVVLLFPHSSKQALHKTINIKDKNTRTRARTHARTHTHTHTHTHTRTYAPTRTPHTHHHQQQHPQQQHELQATSSPPPSFITGIYNVSEQQLHPTPQAQNNGGSSSSNNNNNNKHLNRRANFSRNNLKETRV